MAKATPSIVSFNGGETSPKIDARSDLDKYYSACRTLENALPLIEGGATRTPGEYYICGAKYNDKKCRMVSFSFSTVQSYAFELGNLYMRPYKDKGRIVIDESMADFNPASAFFVGEYTKVGKSVDIGFAGSKHLYISAPYGRPNSGTIKIEATTNGADTLSITTAGDTITIAFANTTGSKNAANLIQVGVRALGVVNAVDVSDWYATENAAYAAARPVAATLAPTFCSGGETLFQCASTIVISASNTNHYPPAEATFWTLVAEGDPVEIITPYLEADLFKIKFFQSADVMYLQHPSYPPKKITRASHINWKLENDVCEIGVKMAITGITKAFPAVVTCTDVPTTLANDDIVYIDNVIGMTEVNEQFYKVASVTTGAAGHFKLVGADSTAYTAWVSGGTSQETIYGIADYNPSCGTFIEQRRVMAGTNHDPQKFNLSHVADYDNFTLDATTTSAGIEYSLVSDRVDRIYWLMGFDFLVAGTEGGIWKIGTSPSTDPMTQASINAKKQVVIGSKDIDPEVLSDVLLWVSNLGTTIYQFAFEYTKDKWVSLDMTRIAKHITYGSTQALSGIVDMDYQKEPIPVLWMIRADGQKIAMTYETQEDIYAFFRVITDGEYESVCVVTQPSDEDVVYSSIKRTINGSTVRHIEHSMPINFHSQIKDCFFVHSGATYDGGAAAIVAAITNADPCVVTLAAGHVLAIGDKVRFSGTGTWLDDNIVTAHAVNVNDITIYNELDLLAVNSASFPVYVSGATAEVVKKTFATGLSHLEAKEVAILVDGAVHSKKTITGGAITLSYYGNKVHIGLPYSTIIEPMKLHAGSQLGTARGKKQKVYKATVMFYETVGAKIGQDRNDLKTIPFGTGIQPELFTGDIDTEFDGDWGNNATISIVQEDPLPMTILGIVPHVTVAE